MFSTGKGSWNSFQCSLVLMQALKRTACRRTYLVKMFISLFLLEKCWAIFCLLCSSYSGKLEAGGVFAVQLLPLIGVGYLGVREGVWSLLAILEGEYREGEQKVWLHQTISIMPFPTAVGRCPGYKDVRMLFEPSALCSSGVSLLRGGYVFNKPSLNLSSLDMSNNFFGAIWNLAFTSFHHFCTGTFTAYTSAGTSYLLGGGGGRILFNSSDSFVGRYGEHVLLSYFLISPVSQVLPSNPPSSQSSLLDPKDWSGWAKKQLEGEKCKRSCSETVLVAGVWGVPRPLSRQKS